MSTPTTTPTARGSRYADLWRAAPRELGYLVIAFPISAVVFGLTIGLFSAAAGTIVTFFIGVIFLIAALYLVRGAGTLELALLRWAGRPEIRRPDWRDGTARTGFLGWLRAVFANGHYWLYLLHAMVVNFVITTITWSITITWFSIGLGGLTAWIWAPFIPEGDRTFWLSQWIVEYVFRGSPDFDGRVGDVVLQLVLGFAFALTLPLITRGLVSLHWAVARGMLGAFRSDELEREVATLTESRGAAVAAEGTALRRLERDIHDGPQQRLVRLQMDLAAAERQLDTDPDAARRLLEEARQQSKDALEELRALSRGFAPPILLDRGLVAALESLAVRSAVTVRVVSSLPEGIALPVEIERNAYFIAVEALTNAVKHSGATAIDLRLAVRRVPDTDETWLDVTVTDDGRGGATSVEGHGIAGLEERLRGLGGILELDSPDGGPTVVTAHLPIVGPAVPSSLGS